MDNRLRIVVVADDPLLRASFRQMLERSIDLEVVGETSAESLAEEHSEYEVILWDLGWGDESTQASLERLLEASETGVPVVALVAQETTAVEARSAGAMGILEREVGEDLIMAALRSATAGLLTIDPNLVDDLLPSRVAVTSSEFEQLTPRELEVLQALANGLTNRAIAVELAVSEHTVKFHVNSILRKLGVQSRTEAVVHATRLGLILL